MLSSNRTNETIYRMLVTFEQPSIEELKLHSRARRYQMLRENTLTKHDLIVHWLKEHDLMDKPVLRVSSGTAFDTLFVDATEDITPILEQIPEVTSATLVDKLPFELLD